MGKEADFLFTVPVGMKIWGLGEHETPILYLKIPVFFCRNLGVPWTIKVTDWSARKSRAFDL